MNFKNYGLPIVVLLVICIVCVGVLAVLNDVLYVSDEVKFARAMAKIYPNGEFTSTTPVEYTNDNFGSVASVTEGKDKNTGDRVVVVEATSTNVGFGSGNVTLYVVIKEAGQVATIEAWSIKDNVGQSYIGKIDGANIWYVGSDISREIPQEDNKTAGATMTSNAINKAINAAAAYARSEGGMGSNPEEAAKNLLVESLANTDYATVEFKGMASADVQHFTTDNAILGFGFKATKDEKSVYALVYDVNGTQMLIAYVDAMVGTDKEIVFKSEGLPASVETAVTNSYFAETGTVKAVVIDGTKATYTVEGFKQPNYIPGNYTLNVVIVDGAITEATILNSGFAPGAPLQSATESILPALVGKTSANIDSAMNSATSGATESANVILTAAKLALTHYDANNGRANPVEEALNNVLSNLTGDYATAQFEQQPATIASHLATSDAILNYVFKATVNEDEVYALVYDVNGAQEYIVYTNKLSVAVEVIVAKSTGLPTTVETAVKNSYFAETGTVKSVVIDGTTATYTVEGFKQPGYVPGNYTLEVVITDGAIVSVEVLVSGFVAYGPYPADTLTIIPALVGKTLANVGSAKISTTSGATESANIIFNAAKLALSHYDANNGGAN